MYIIKLQDFDEDSSAPQSVPPNKRKRTARATPAQIEVLLDHLEKKPFLTSKKFPGVNRNEAWNEVAQELNSIQRGAIKTSEQWMTVWRDLKSKACHKASKIALERKAALEKPKETAPLTDLEQKAFSIAGRSFGIESSCPDRLIDDLIIIQASHPEPSNPQPSNPQPSNPQPSNPQPSNPQPSNPQPSNPQPSNPEYSKPQPKKPQPSKEVDYSIPSVQEDPLRNTSPVDSELDKSESIHRRKSVCEEIRNAKEDYLAVAESNSKSIRMLAEATKVTAEASRRTADAVFMFAQAANKIADALLIYASQKRKE